MEYDKIGSRIILGQWIRECRELAVGRACNGTYINDGDVIGLLTGILNRKAHEEVDTQYRTQK